MKKTVLIILLVFPLLLSANKQTNTDSLWVIYKDTHLYLFSDGYADQFHWKDRSLFGDKQFKKLLIEIHKKEPDEQKKLLAESIDAWKGNSPQIDDILVIGIKV